MTKRRLLRCSLLLVVLAALAIWLEPTRVVWGWLRGEAFYQGRPTSWWAVQLGNWQIPSWISEDTVAWGPKSVWHSRRQSRVNSALSSLMQLPEVTFPAILQHYDIGRDAWPVLEELAQHPDLETRKLAKIALNTSRMRLEPMPIRVHGGVGP